jgi:uncharacterized OB-fold protein
MSTPDGPLPPMPVPDELTQFFWDGAARYCQSRNLAGERVSGKAKLYSWTIATQPFHPFWVDRVPYTLATVELAEQSRLMFLSQVVECPEEELRAGMPLEVTFEELSPELTVPFFRPVREDAS